MTTIVNNPPLVKESGGGIGLIIGFIVIVALVAGFLAFGLPVIRQMSTPHINIPDKIDVNIKTQTK